MCFNWYIFFISSQFIISPQWLTISSITVIPLFRHDGRDRVTVEIWELNHSGDWINSELFSGVLWRQKSAHCLKTCFQKGFSIFFLTIYTSLHPKLLFCLDHQLTLSRKCTTVEDYLSFVILIFLSIPILVNSQSDRHKSFLCPLIIVSTYGIFTNFFGFFVP